MKKIFISITVLFLLIFPKVYAYSDGFEYMITAMNMEKVNVNGLTLNEEVYEKYKLLVYGSPSKIKSNKQRWKNVENGNWTLSGGAWNGNGTRGEYWILGEDYSGKLVHNEVFPDDYNSGTSPLYWNYRTIKDAEESWSDASKYQYEIQREYMLTQKLSRFGVIYDITALDIGLDKARVENYATWGSAGSIYTEKPGTGNVYWVATFSVPPMAGGARLNSILTFQNGTEYTISKNEDIVEIPLQFGAYVDNLSEYAKAEHIQIIEAELKVEGISENTVSGTKVLKISKDGNIIINKQDYPNQKKVTLKVECNSFLSTCFVSDPIIYATNSQTIVINIESEEKNVVNVVNDKEAPFIYSCTLKRVSTNSKGKEELVDLYQSKKTGTGFICAGQVLQIEIKTSADADKVTFDFSGKNSIRVLDELTQKFEWEDPKSRNERTRYSTLQALQKSYNLPRSLSLKSETESYKIYTATYVIPYGTTQTLHSWNSLREISKDAFKIDETKLFTRKESAYTLVIKAYGGRDVRTKQYTLDVADRWDELYNRDISKYVTINTK